VSYVNARCQFEVPIGDNALQRTRGVSLSDEYPCSFRQMTMAAEQSAFGVVGVGTYRIRVNCGLDVRVGWRVNVSTNEGKKYTAVVRRTSKVYHLDLVVEAV